jgi:hypothetical protein
MAVLLPEGKQSYETAAGIPLVGGQIFTYDVGTTNPRITWSDAAQSNPNLNPVVLDARGEAVIFWSGDYTVTLTDALGNQIWSVDNIDSNTASLFDNYSIDSGIANAYIANGGIPTSALVAGLKVALKVNATNTGPSTLNYGGLGIKDVFVNGVPLVGAEIRAGNIYLFEYDGLNFQLLNPTFGYPQTAAEVIAGVLPANMKYQELDPRRYGAVGDGVTVDTTAINIWAGVINASVNPVSHWPSGLTFMCGPIVPSYLPAQNILGVYAGVTPIANSFTWICWSTIKSIANSITGVLCWLQINAATVRIQGLTMDGNASAYAGPAGNASLLVDLTTDLLLDDCSIINGPGKGVLFQQTVNARVSNCHFDNNGHAGGGSGIETNRATYLKFVNCTFNLNGFGSVLRFRSNHIDFTNCECQQNTHDGFNTNQGSYAIKYIGCVAWMNGDGGYTIASDQTSTGIPGEAEACYDLEYTDSEAYNNASSGIAAYTPCYNVTVTSGRYYNNNHIAGSIATQSSFLNGIYIAAGSQGIKIRTKAYDDRQLCPVTAQSGGVVTATGWLPGTMANYPKVALYNASLVFQGWGTITAESAGSVNVATVANNGVTVSNIIAGWFISQRVQHNGVFLDNNVQGSADVDGFGFLPGPYTFTGFKTISGFTNNGQNILLPAATLDYTELLANPTFDSVITSWTYSLVGGGTSTLYTTPGAQLKSVGALQLVGGSSAALADASLIASGVNYLQGAWVEASVWCYAIAPGDAQLIMIWNVASSGNLTTVINHPGGGSKLLKIGAYIPQNTTCTLRLVSAIGKTNYFDSASLRVKTESYDNRDFLYPSRNLPV